jgi:hypothetical protein
MSKASYNIIHFRIEYLKLGIKEKIGDVDNLNLIENSTKLENIREIFPKQNYFFRNYLGKCN